MKRVILAVMLMSSPALAGESVIVLSDNTTIKTGGYHEPRLLPQFEVETADIELNDPTGDAECFDRAKKVANRRDRYALLERCLG